MKATVPRCQYNSRKLNKISIGKSFAKIMALRVVPKVTKGQGCFKSVLYAEMAKLLI